MTKRIFAIVLALVLSMSLFAVDVFAAGMTVTATVSGTSITVSWTTYSGADHYHVNLYKDGKATGSSIELKGATSYTYSNLEAGQYHVNVRPYDANEKALESSSTSSNTVTIGSTTNQKVWVSNGMLYWQATTSGKYVVAFTNNYGSIVNGGTYENVTGTQFNLGSAPYGATKVSVYDYVTKQLIGTASLTGSSSTGSNVYVSNGYLVWNTSYTGTFTINFYNSYNSKVGSYQTTGKSWPLTTSTVPSTAVRAEILYGSTSIGSCYLNGSNNSGYNTNTSVYLINRGTNTATIGWANLSSTQYYVKYTGGNGQSTTILATSTQATIPCISSETVAIEITAVNGVYMGQKLTATLTPSGITGSTNVSTGTNSGNLYVYKSNYGYTVSWPATGAGLYQVSYKKTTDAVYTTLNAQTTNSVVVPYTESDSWTISVAAYVNGGFQLIGTYTATPSGTVGGTTGTTTTTGTGCTVVSSATSSTVTWSSSGYGVTYTVLYTVDGSTARTLQTTNTSITLPVGNSTNFTVYVLANNTIIATAEVKKVSGSTSTTDPSVDADEEVAYDTVTGFWAETLGDGVVKLSWNAVEDADNYKVYYRKAGTTKWSGGTGSFVRTKTNLSIRFKNSSTYEFKIVAGDEESTVLTIKPSSAKGTVAWAMNADSDADYETNLAAVVKDADNGKITLTWEEVKGADYKVYYRKAGTTTWKGGYERSGESITITFKSSNIDNTYEIKIVADGDDSDIFDLTPAVWANAD